MSKACLREADLLVVAGARAHFVGPACNLLLFHYSRSSLVEAVVEWLDSITVHIATNPEQAEIFQSLRRAVRLHTSDCPPIDLPDYLLVPSLEQNDYASLPQLLVLECNQLSSASLTRLARPLWDGLDPPMRPLSFIPSS